MPASPRALEITHVAARAASDKKAQEIVALDVSERLVLTDVFLITSGSNERQVKAVAEAVDEALHRIGVKAVRREGLRHGRWVLLDYGDVVVHVQHGEDRVYYSLERLWADCPVIGLAELQGEKAVGA